MINPGWSKWYNKVIKNSNLYINNNLGHFAFFEIEIILDFSCVLLHFSPAVP